MPKTKLGEKYSKPTYPPIDQALGMVLARKAAMNLDLKTLADMSGLSYSHVRSVWGKSPAEWTQETRDKILPALGLKARLIVEDAGE